VRIAEIVFTTVEGDPMQPRTRSVVLEDNALWQNAQLAIGNVAFCDRECMYAFQKWFQIFLRPLTEVQLIDSTHAKSCNAPQRHPAPNSTMANQPCSVDRPHLESNECCFPEVGKSGIVFLHHLGLNNHAIDTLGGMNLPVDCYCRANEPTRPRRMSDFGAIVTVCKCTWFSSCSCSRQGWPTKLLAICPTLRRWRQDWQP
jgi:hypothetical protein